MTFGKVSIIGLGLLGGSIGKDLRERGLAKQVAAYARREETIREGHANEAADEISSDLLGIVEGSDLVILCTPIFQMHKLSEMIVRGVGPGTVVTDVGSVKSYVVEHIEPVFTKHGIDFVGSHPMAGSEKAGVSAAVSGLFENATCVVTPSTGNKKDAVEKVKSLWQAIGGRPVIMSPEEHDELVARCSHLPHVLSSALSRFVLNPRWPKEQSDLSGTGFRDISRLASGSPEMWKDISLSNRSAIIQAIIEWTDELDLYKSALENQDENAILEFFEQAKVRRDLWLENFMK